MPSTPTDLPHRRLPDPIDLLRCPLCGNRLRRERGSVACARQHSFDIARQGYIGLLTGNMRTGSADTADMVAARVAFLHAGHYAPLAATLGRLVAGRCAPGSTVLDAGTGTGHYLAAVLDACPGTTGLGLDVSKYALRRAARAHPRATVATWDVWKPLPIGSGTVDVLLNVFAPRNGPEFQRVLGPGGTLLVVTPTDRHMAELRARVPLLAVDAAKPERLANTLSAHFTEEETCPLEYTVRLSATDATNLLSMGPTGHHLMAGEAAGHAAELDTPIEMTVSFLISVYGPR
ncbi:putative RNA methyltransferase [Streptomyces oceani]|uniref:Methyltransferase type 11 n=1 Tax=Streptomyces oceani TaxID=1075402 RepID=A0A1E7KIR9_9ACTN|nr:methyltransferase domain-containing protein [Streptomyces oceani]OEV03839.1 methyltransferase type 11 [Streptomyces oceani]